MRLLLTDGKDNKNYYKEKVSVNGIKGYILHEKTIAQDKRLMDYKELEKILDKYDVELNVERNIDR